MSVFGKKWVVLERVGGVSPKITDGVAVARAVRGGLLAHGGTLPEMLSGHREGVGRGHHLAVVPLPWVGTEADGRVRGVALVLPADATSGERQTLLDVVERWERSRGEPDAVVPALRVWMGRAGVVWLRRRSERCCTWRTLQPPTWCRSSRRWVSVTPVALDRNPGRLDLPERRVAAEERARAGVIEACERLGLPVPIDVTVGQDALMEGTRAARKFPPFPPGPPGRRGPRRVKVHVALRFGEEVEGPLLLGAGRHVGLGLFRPVGAS